MYRCRPFMRSATKSRLLLPAHLDGGSGGGSTPGMAWKQLWSQRKSLNLRVEVSKRGGEGRAVVVIFLVLSVLRCKVGGTENTPRLQEGAAWGKSCRSILQPAYCISCLCVTKISDGTQQQRATTNNKNVPLATVGAPVHVPMADGLKNDNGHSLARQRSSPDSPSRKRAGTSS